MVVSYTNVGILIIRKNHTFVVFFRKTLNFPARYMKTWIPNE